MKIKALTEFIYISYFRSQESIIDAIGQLDGMEFMLGMVICITF